ncbi:MAG: HAMP domain-containing sensor histidine kinase, partial [Cyclobacteriaceae bacterium]|nr:HAMP domain-containing sensor histidine kinase [Cyclobacteriaceae bacterium]
FCTIINAKRAGNSEAIIILYGLFFSTPFFLLGIYFNNTIARVSLDSSLNLFFPVEIGLLIFLGFQVYLLAQYYAKSYKALSNVNVALEQQVNERSKKLMETSLVKDKLLSIISHDVKAPINSLRGALMLFNKGILETKEFKDLATNIEEELNKTALLIDGILHWSKIQLNGNSINNELFDLHELIESNIQLFKTTAERKSIHFDYTISTQVVCWDKQILNMVLRNLLANAIKFSHHKGHISIYVKNEKDQILIGVRDYGVGMDDAFIQTISQPAKVISQPGTEGEKGNGIGLALAREYLVKAGGKLLCTSKANEGTEFLICFSNAQVKA